MMSNGEWYDTAKSKNKSPSTNKNHIFKGDKNFSFWHQGDTVGTKFTNQTYTLPKANSSPLKLGLPKR